MKQTKYIFYLLIGIVSSSCSEFQEPQLDREKLEILTPRDSLRTSVATQQFFWYELDDAVEYELQIVSPSFALIDRFILDTVITKNKLFMTLTPGEYQWSVRAFNYSSASPYTVQTLFIDSTINLSTQTLQLISPKDFDTSNQTSQSFNWQKIYNAQDYSFELWTPTETGTLIHQAVIEEDTLRLNNLAEGSYVWKVRAQNQLTNSVFTKRSLLIDTTSPNKPLLLEPDTNAVISDDKIDFKWSRGIVNTGAEIIDSLYISQNSSFASFYRMARTSDNLAVIDSLPFGNYFWRVKSFDAAKNESEFSETRKLTVN